MRLSSAAAALTLVVALAACGGGGSGSSGSASSSAAPTAQEPAATSGDARIVAAQAYADAHPYTVQILHGKQCLEPAENSAVKARFAHVPYVHITGGGSGKDGYGATVPCLNLSWSVPITIVTPRPGYYDPHVATTVIGHYVVEKMGDTVTDAAGENLMPWSGHLATTPMYRYARQVSLGLPVPPLVVTDGQVNESKDPNGNWVAVGMSIGR